VDRPGIPIRTAIVLTLTMLPEPFATIAGARAATSR
jgi:hypothetical protein